MRATFRILALFASGCPAVALAQSQQLIDTVDKFAAAHPAPSTAELAPRALEAFRQRARADGRCLPRAVSVGAPASALLTMLVAQRRVAGEILSAWTSVVRPSGCSDDRPGRFIIYRQNDGSLDVQLMSMGEGIALPLQQDLFLLVGGFAYAKLNSIKGGCAVDKLRFESTRIAARSDDLGPDVYGARFRGSWSETWTFSGCDRLVEATVAFVTDGEGGLRYTVDNRQVRFVGKGG